MNTNQQLSPKTGGRGNSDRMRWLGLFGLAFGLRLIYIWQSRSNPLFGHPVVDAQSYEEWSILMARGEWLWYYVHNYLPIYPAFLALQKILWGGAPWINKLLQALMGSLTVVLVAQIARNIWDRRTGLITGLLLAGNWMLVVFEGEKYAESFSLFFLVLTLWLLICRRHRPRTALAAGWAFALAAGCRANLFLMGPFILLWLLLVHRARPWPAARNGLLFALGTILLIGPIAYRNYQLCGAPLLRVQAGWSFYSALTPRFGGLHPPAGALFRKEIRRPFRAGLRSEVAIEKFWFARARETIRNQPAAVLATQFTRLLVFCNARQWSQEFDVYAYRDYSPVLRLTAPLFWLLLPLGLLGLLLLRRDRSNTGKVLLLMCLLLSFLSIFPFKASDRYRLPTLVLLTPLAGYAVGVLLEMVQKRRIRALLAAGGILGGLLFLCWPDWPDLEGRKTARHDYFVGLALEAKGRQSDAMAAYQRSLARHSWDPDAPYHLARILIRRNLLDQARPYLQMAVEREPDFPEAFLELGYIALEQHDLEGAKHFLQHCLVLYPRCIDGLLLMARLFREIHNFEQEDEYYRRAVVEAHFPSVRDARFADIALERSLRLAERKETGKALSQLDEIIATPEVRTGKKATAALIAGGIAAREDIRLKDGRKYWEALMNGSPRKTFPWYAAAFMLGRMDTADFSAYLKTRTDPGQRAFGCYILGLTYHRRGKAEAARRTLGKCLLLPSAETDPLFCAGQQGAWRILQEY